MRNITEGLLAPQSSKTIEANILIMRQENIATDLFNRFINTFEGIKNSATKTLESLINDSSLEKLNRSLGTIKSDFNSTRNLIDKLNYVTLASLPLPCPDGFQKDFTGYVTLLEEQRVELTTNALNLLEEFNVYLASFIGNSSSRISVQDQTRAYKKAEAIRKKQEQEVQSFFSSGTNQRTPLNKMFASKADIEPTLEKSFRTFETVSKVNLQGLVHEINKMAERMNLIIEGAKNGASNMEVSKQGLLNLSEGAFEVASQVEHLAKYIARCEIAAVTSGNITHRLKEKLD